MKRTIVLVVAIVALLLGVGSVVLGAVGIAVFGTAGKYSMNVGSGSSNGAAIYVSGFQVSANSLMSAVTGITVEAASADGKQLFIGAGPPSKVQGYLAGVPYSAVSDIVNGQLQVSEVPGKGTASPPAGQNIWVLQDQGSTPKITWGSEDAGQVLVVMNADGSRGVKANLTLSASSTSIFPISIGMVVLGGVLMLVGIYLIVRRRRASTPPAAGSHSAVDLSGGSSSSHQPAQTSAESTK